MIECISYHWSPAIGDPSIIGWATVLAYLVAAALTFLRARDAFGAAYPAEGALKFFWLAISIVLVLLAFNKQMDFQSALTAAGRCLALDQGWYGERGGVQQNFMIGVGLAGVMVFVIAAWSLRQHLRAQWMVLTGLFLLIAFVLLRASSFHHMDIFIHSRVLGVKMNWLIELGALALIIAGARKRRPSVGPQVRP
jgi:preprotein translocase subunit SecG